MSMESFIIIILVIIVLIIFLFLTTSCCVYYYCCREKPQKYRYSPLPQQEEFELEVHSDCSTPSVSYSHLTEQYDTELGQLSSSLSSLSQDEQQPGHGAHDFSYVTEAQPIELGEQNLQQPQTIVELEEQIDTSSVTNSAQSSELEQELTLPLSIKTYIVDILIPYFKDQRAGNQFAVVLLLSEAEYHNINEVKLSPSDTDGRPHIIDNSQTTLPSSTEYCNYIVARPTIDKRRKDKSIHSEKEIFGNCDHNSTKSRFDELWSAYYHKHGQVYPEYILIYSWNLPCKDCTDLIITSLQKSPYDSVAVLVIYTSEWKGEKTSDQHELNQKKLQDEGIAVKKVKYRPRIKKLFVSQRK